MNYFCALEYRLAIYELPQVRDSNLDVMSITLARQVLSTLAEIVSGPNEGNQISLIETNKLFNPLNKILSIPLQALIDKCPRDPITVGHIVNLKQDVVMLLLTFLEGQKNSYIYTHAVSSINRTHLVRTEYS